jgi:peptidoglycan hydrolase CwlO-like protein
VTTGEWFDTVLRTLAVLGFPAIIMFWLRDRRRIQNQDTRDEQQLPFQVRTTAATTLDAEVVALQKAFELDRQTRNRTIEDLRKENESLHTEVELKNQKIDELKSQVERLQDLVQRLQDQLENVRQELVKLKP